MRPLEQKFTSRQYMIDQEFEFYHYKDETLLEVDYHNHLFYEVYFFLSGRVTLIIEGKAYRLRPGDIILINNKDLHKPIIEPGEIYERYVLWIDPEYIKSLSQDTDLSQCFDLTSRNRFNLLRPGSEHYMMIKNIVTRLEKAYFSNCFGHHLLKKVYLTELLVYLNRALLDNRDEDIEIDIAYNDKVSDIINYINDNLQNDLSLETLSSLFYVSKYHLLREFKKHNGYTIHQYIYKKRLILARVLLKEGLKVTEVSLRCGFGDYSNFIRAFKNEFGLSPKRYGKKG